MSSEPPATASMSLGTWGLLIALSVLWGGSFFFNQVAVAEWPVFSVVVCRVVIAAVILHAVIRLMGITLPTDRASLTAFATMGLINNALPFSLIVNGQTEIGSGLASILNATAPLFTVVIAHVATRDEKTTAARLAGVCIGFVGVAVMVGRDALDTIGASTLAQVSCLGGALCYAIAGVYGRRFKRLGIAPMATATGQATAASLFLVPAMIVVDQPWTLPVPSGAAIASLICVAALSTALAYAIYFRIMQSTGATNLLLVTFLVPVTAILLGVLVLGERLLLVQIGGMVLIGVGLACIDGRPLRLLGIGSRRGVE